MKFLFITDLFESNYLRDRPTLCKFLANRGHKVTVISSRYLNGKILKKEYFYKWDMGLHPAVVVRCKSLAIPRIPGGHLILFFHPKQILTKPDILHVHGLGSFSSFLGVLVRLIFPRIRMVVTADLDRLTHVRAQNSIIYKHVISLPLKVADAVVAYTLIERDFLTQMGTEKSKIYVIPNGIHFVALSRIKKRLNRNKIVLGFLGKFEMAKGIHRLVSPLSRIMRMYPQTVKVIFAGAIQEKKYSSKILEKLGKLDNFEYWGPLPMSAVYEFFQKCDIVLFPSLSEGYPAIPLEAMAAGKPVIASNMHPMNEYIEHGVSGFLVDNDEQIYDYAKLLLDNPKLIKDIGRNAREKVASHSWENIVTKLEEMYSKLLKFKGK